MNIRRRTLLAAAALGGLLPVARAKPAAPTMVVWKSPTCGCCKDWMHHIEEAGIKVTSRDDGNTDIRAKMNMPLRYGSCHTGIVGGYVVEGHVPAREVLRLLKEKPAAVGIAAPGMPLGSPGMDGPEYGGRRTPYDVLLVRKDGSSVVYQSYR